MCILMQINVYHYCSHTQRVSVPSVNPNCGREVLGRGYLMGEWCPRCRWTGFIAPYEYVEFAEGLPCKGYTGKVTRTVKLDPGEFKHPKTKEQIWAGRIEYQKRMLEFRGDQEVEKYTKIRDLEEQQEPPISDLDRTYLMEENEENEPDFNHCPALFYNLNQDAIPDDKEVCGICTEKLKTLDVDGRCASGLLIVLLPCDHYFGQRCITQWMRDPKTPTCPECRHRYKIKYQIPPGGLSAVVPPGFEEQLLVDFYLDVDVRWLYLRLMLIYYLKMAFIAVLFAPFPWMSWTNLWMLTFGGILFYCSFIQLIQLTPVFSPRERIIQNRFAVFSAFGNTIELLFARAIGVPGPSLLVYGASSWVLLTAMIYIFRPTFRLPV